MKLREAIDKLMKVKGWVQDDLADHLGTRQSTISKLRNSDEWEAHWQLFLRLLPLCLKERILTENELLRGTHDGKHDSSTGKKVTVPRNPGKKTGQDCG